MQIPRIPSLLSILAFVVPACAESPAAPPESATATPAESAAPAEPAPAATEPPAAPAADTAEPPSAPTASAEPPPSASTASAAPAPASSGSKKDTHAAHAAAEPAPAPAASVPADAVPGSDACQTKNFHYTQVANACKSGGRKAAKGVMKGAVKKAKEAGADVQCLSCHEDLKNFHLKSNAVADLKKWL
jgi:hypothetical protein